MLSPVAFAVSTSNSIYWLLAFSTNFITPRLLGPPLYIHGYHYVIAACNLMGALLVFLGFPETKVLGSTCGLTL